MLSVLKGLHLFVLLLLAIGLCKADLPPEIEKCHAGETDCIAQAINEIVRRYPDGNPSFGLPRLNQMKLDNITISNTNPNSGVQLNFKLLSATFYGFENTNVTRVVGFGEDPLKSKYEVYAQIPDVRILSPYECDGKVLLLALHGKGDAEIKMKNAKFAVKVKVEMTERDGKRFAKLKSIKSVMQTDKLFVNLDNIFAGNKELSDSLNRVLNENWRDLWSEIQAGINKAVNDVLRSIISGVLDKLPYDDFYLK